MVAAATTSLPERAREGRNYDYRYVWIRDQCYTGQAVAKAGPYPLMDDAVRFVTERLLRGRPGAQARLHDDRRQRARPASAQPARLPGRHRHRRQLGQQAVPARRVRGGAAAVRFSRRATITSTPTAGAPRRPRSRRSPERWRERDTDAGIWEIDPDAWTHSRLICAAGLRQIAGHGPAGEHAAQWVSLADEIVSDTAKHALHQSGRWQRSPSDPRPDAALLLAAIRGAIPPSDPRSIATLRAIEDGAHPGRLLLPLPPRRAPARRGRGRVPAVRVLHVARLQPAGRPRHGSAVV